jgi:hypothetical protein
MENTFRNCRVGFQEMNETVPGVYLSAQSIRSMNKRFAAPVSRVLAGFALPATQSVATLIQ